MSNYLSAYHETGLILNESEFTQFLNTYAKIRQLDKPFTRPTNEELYENISIDEYDFIRSYVKNEPKSLYECFNIISLPAYATEGYYFSPFVRPNNEFNIYDEINRTEVICDTDNTENHYAIFTDCSMDGPIRWIKPVYPTYESVLKECKDKLERYLPKNFDWNAHIGQINYIIYG